MSIVVTIPEEKIDELIDKAVKKVKDKIIRELLGDILEIQKSILRTLNELAEAQKRTEERLNSLAQEVQRLAEAQKRTEERLNELAEAQKRTEERLNELAEAQRKTEERLNSLVGEVANLKGEVTEIKVINGLDSSLRRYGFSVYPASKELRNVDAIIEGDDIVGIIEICRRCDLRDVRQVLEGKKHFVEVEGVEPDVLIIFSYASEIPEEVRIEAEKHGIIVENSIRRLKRKLLEILNKK